MTNWPDAPFIRVIKGTEYGDEISDTLATRNSNGDYLLIDGPRACRRLVPDVDCDSIDEWEEITPIPTAALKRLRDERGRETSLRGLRDAIDDVLDALPADKPSPLDQAAKAAEEYDSGEALEVKGYMTRLLRVAGEDDAYPTLRSLLAVVGSTMEYLRHAGFINPKEEIIIEAGDVTLTSAPDASFVLLAKYIGRFLASRESDVAILVGAVALAWAAQIIEEEE